MRAAANEPVRQRACSCVRRGCERHIYECTPQKGPLDIAVQTVRKEGVLALYKGAPLRPPSHPGRSAHARSAGMASPLVGMTGVNALLFAAYGAARRLISPFPELSLAQTAAAGALAGAANTVLASPVEMLKIRMQGQYGAQGDQRLRAVAGELWAQWGLRQGLMRGFWVGPSSFVHVS
jgi:solute carrier family 25 carnitine/acylcarnitine transporter 20/29